MYKMNENKNRYYDKKNGFTLVEVIVVAVIVLILSAVAIPLYNGYIRDARWNTVTNLAETAAADANAHFRRTGDNMPINTLTERLHYDNVTHSVVYAGGNPSTEVRVCDLRETNMCHNVPFR